MTKRGVYSKVLHVSVTPEMYDFVQLLASRHKSTMAEEVRQALRDHLDAQDDVIGSRSRLGRRVMTELERMRHQLRGEISHQARLQLAAMIILLAEHGLSGPDIVKRIKDLAALPELERAVQSKGER